MNISDGTKLIEREDAVSTTSPYCQPQLPAPTASPLCQPTLPAPTASPHCQPPTASPHCQPPLPAPSACPQCHPHCQPPLPAPTVSLSTSPRSILAIMSLPGRKACDIKASLINSGLISRRLRCGRVSNFKGEEILLTITN